MADQTRDTKCEDHGLEGVTFDNIAFAAWHQPWRSVCTCGWASVPMLTVGQAGEEYDHHLSERDPGYDALRGYDRPREVAG